MQDDYKYEPFPLPPLRTFGGDAESNSGIPAISPPVNYPLSSALETNDPFGNPASQPSTPGQASLKYITDAAAAVFGTGPLGSSTSTTINSGAAGDNLLLLTTTDLGTGSAVLNLGANKIWLSVADVLADSGQVELKELDVCHLGAPGFRQFFCGDSYA